MNPSPVIIVWLRAKHFDATTFTVPMNGLFYNAIRDIERFKHVNIEETPDGVIVGNHKYSHDGYTLEMFMTDLKIAEENIFDHTEIRLLKLKLINTNVAIQPQ